jgi:hypothetical protein
MSAVAQSRANGARTYAASAYGLRIRSVVPLPAGGAAGDARTDTDVRWADLESVTRGLRARSLAASVTEMEAAMVIPGIGTFLARLGREILVDPDPGAGSALLQLALLGPVLAALLQQRGNLVLHASAVEVDGAAVGFLGGRGAGKSTMAAALLGRGYPLLADDLLAVSLDGGSPRVLPGLPQLKLWPDALAALGGDPDLLPPVRKGLDKRVQKLGGHGRSGDVPLARLYVLSSGEEPTIEAIPSGAAFLELVSHSYGIAWLHGVSGPGQFAARTELARRVPVCRLRRPSDLDRLDQVIRLVEEDLGTQ